MKVESNPQSIKRICLKWRFKNFQGYCPILSLINSLQREERKRRILKWRIKRNLKSMLENVMNAQKYSMRDML